MEKRIIKKYMLVINYCEEETYLYDTIEDMLKDWDSSSIEELLDKSSIWSTYTIYEVCGVWSKDNG